MTNEQLEIARAFVECGRWQWLPGMRAGYVFADSPDDLWWDRLCGEPGHLVGAAQGLEVQPSGTYPNPTTHVAVDHTDPATLGCVRHIVVGVWDIVDWDLAQVGRTNWYFGFVTPDGEDFDFWGSTEAEALLRALQAAPEAKDGN